MKPSKQMTDRELRRDIYETRRYVEANIKAVRELQKGEPSLAIPTYATNQYALLKRQMRDKSVKKMSRTELISTRRQLQYIKGLKSSTVEGAKETAVKFSPLADKLKALSPQLQDKFWEIYRKAYSDTKGQLERFRYELFSSDLIDQVGIGTDTGELAHLISEKYRELELETTKDTPEEEKRELFTQRLKSIYK